MRRTFATALALSALIGSPLAGCDGAGGPQGDAEVSAFQTEDGRTVELRIADDYPGPLRAFGSPDEYVAHMDSLRAGATALTVRRSVWEDLEGLGDPFFAALLDADASVVVGQDVYTATATALYGRPVGSPASSRTLEVYYGEDGGEEAREYDEVYALSSDPEALRNVTFKNPHVQAVADRIVAAGGFGTAAPGSETAGAAPTGSSGARGVMWGLEQVFGPSVRVTLYDRSDPYYNAGSSWDVRVSGYNQDGGSWWRGYWAAGNTQMSVYSYQDNAWGKPGVGDRPSELGSYVDLTLLLKRDSPTRAWDRLSCVTGRGDYLSPDDYYYYSLPWNFCTSLNTNDSRATGWDPKSEHTYRIYSWEPGTPRGSFDVVADRAFSIN